MLFICNLKPEQFSSEQFNKLSLPICLSTLKRKFQFAYVQRKQISIMIIEVAAQLCYGYGLKKETRQARRLLLLLCTVQRLKRVGLVLFKAL